MRGHTATLNGVCLCVSRDACSSDAIDLAGRQSSVSNVGSRLKCISRAGYSLQTLSDTQWLPGIHQGPITGIHTRHRQLLRRLQSSLFCPITRRAAILLLLLLLPLALLPLPACINVYLFAPHSMDDCSSNSAAQRHRSNKRSAHTFFDMHTPNTSISRRSA